ncbi:hypothetical protein NM75_01340 [Dickeya fangzhongdai]|nr:hypothetical protein LH89_08330 [Dickeya fangzhongdai]KGU00024.1 hypothetical protein NM75_01340 [Dickeya fangzhongdai]
MEKTGQIAHDNINFQTVFNCRVIYVDTRFLDIKDLLAMKCSNLILPDLRVFTDWAEKTMIEGSESSNILILASLGLDKNLEKEDVFFYFDAYLREICVDYPDSLESLFFYFRYSFRRILFSEHERDVYNTLHDIGCRYIESDSPALHRVISYWSGVYNDFVCNYDDECGYLYIQYERHKEIPHEQAIDYIKLAAKRFLRYMDCDYFYELVRRRSSP